MTLFLIVNEFSKRNKIQIAGGVLGIPAGE
jgi:hypothetical protein